jgi:hypothetical protein
VGLLGELSLSPKGRGKGPAALAVGRVRGLRLGR